MFSMIIFMVHENSIMNVDVDSGMLDQTRLRPHIPGFLLDYNLW